MRAIEIIVGIITIILMRDRIVLALMILFFPDSWIEEMIRKTVKEIDGA